MAKCTYFRFFHLYKLFYYLPILELVLCCVCTLNLVLFLLVLSSRTRIQFRKILDQEQTIYFKRPNAFPPSVPIWQIPKKNSKNLPVFASLCQSSSQFARDTIPQSGISYLVFNRLQWHTSKNCYIFEPHGQFKKGRFSSQCDQKLQQYDSFSQTDFLNEKDNFEADLKNCCIFFCLTYS